MPSAGEVVGRQNHGGRPRAHRAGQDAQGPVGLRSSSQAGGGTGERNPPCSFPSRAHTRDPRSPGCGREAVGPPGITISAGLEHRDAEMDTAPRSTVQVCPRRRGDGW